MLYELSHNVGYLPKQWNIFRTNNTKVHSAKNADPLHILILWPPTYLETTGYGIRVFSSKVY